jgi:RHH-type proline utilization regulon transcriptional repressor/proline dehydrogenase/delta 1-pyrroline-5-carboxylate dehydrogenase
MAYADAIAQIAKAASGKDISSNPGISIKLSALHPKYDLRHRAEVMDVLVPRARSLALLAKSAGIGLNIDAEEAARLDLSLDVIEAVLSEPSLAQWDGFGVVVQAYGKRAAYVIDWLYALAQKLDRRIMVRLVKGAYWDTEIKLAQVEALPGFPVLATKPHTDISYMCCAQKLLAMSDRIYPQFATHNAHTIAAVLHSAAAQKVKHFEFQRLHGMGEALHDQVLRKHGVACRIYAPVGHHSDLLAYLVRRLLENGANSSFVNQIFDAEVPAHVVAADPFEKQHEPGPKISQPADIFAPERPIPKVLICRIPRFWRSCKPSARDARPGAMAILANLIRCTAPPRAIRLARLHFYPQTKRGSWPRMPPLGRSPQPSGPRFCAKQQIFMKTMQRNFLLCSPMRPVKH